MDQDKPHKNLVDENISQEDHENRVSYQGHYVAKDSSQVSLVTANAFQENLAAEDLCWEHLVAEERIKAHLRTPGSGRTNVHF